MTGIFALKLCTYLRGGKAVVLGLEGLQLGHGHCFQYIFHRLCLFWLGHSRWGTSLSPQDSSCAC